MSMLRSRVGWGAAVMMLAAAACGGGSSDDPVPVDPNATPTDGTTTTNGQGTVGPDDMGNGIGDPNPNGGPPPADAPAPGGPLPPAPVADGGAPLCQTAASDPAAATTVGGYLDKLGNAGPKGALRTAVIDAIIRACDVFGAPTTNPGWQRSYCWAQLASSALKESSYNPQSVVTDAAAKRTVNGQTANDPTVGLLQIRFSSAVRNYTLQGPRDRLACIGCTLPAVLDQHKNESGDSTFWAVTGPTANLSTMENVACNIGIGAWYYYYNATGNGKSTAPTYLSDYCSGHGTAANIITGLRTYVEGPNGGKGIISNMTGVNALQSTDTNVYNYITAIKGSFDTMVGPVNGTHPFFLILQPHPPQYCK